VSSQCVVSGEKTCHSPGLSPIKGQNNEELNNLFSLPNIV